MLTRVAFCVVAALSLAACSTVSDRYAFWRDDGPPATQGHEPNLADVPTAPDTAATKAELDSMKQRLEQDRNNAYLAAQGVVPLDANGAPVQTSTAEPVAAPMTPAQPVISKTDLPPPSVAPQPAAGYVSTGNVQYNYSNEYDPHSYGSNAVQVNPQVYGGSSTAQSGVVRANDNVTIDYSALGIAPSNSMQSFANGQPVVYFAHGSSHLGAMDRKHIRDLAAQLKAQQGSVVVAGYASHRTGLRDAAAAKVVNLRMSEMRATAVLHELARNGVDPNKVQLNAYGDSKPIAPPAMGQNTEDVDRRVDILFDQ